MNTCTILNSSQFSEGIVHSSNSAIFTTEIGSNLHQPCNSTGARSARAEACCHAPPSLSQADYVSLRCLISYRGQGTMAFWAIIRVILCSGQTEQVDETWNLSNYQILNLLRAIKKEHCCKRQGKAGKQVSLPGAVTQCKTQCIRNSGYKSSRGSGTAETTGKANL